MDEVNSHHLITLILILRRNLQESPWARVRSLHDWIRSTHEELDEAQAATTNSHRAEELGDVLYDVLTAILVLERETSGMISIDVIIWNALEKLRRRKPWLENGTAPATAEEELVIWNAAKALEIKR